MAEKTLNDPLSSDEIREIILQQIDHRLKGDCTLTGNQAYAGFTAKFEIKISYVRSLTPPTLVWGLAEGAALADVATESAGEAAIASEYVSPAPNVARSDHNLPIPVMIQTPTGPQRKRVQIERPKR